MVESVLMTIMVMCVVMVTISLIMINRENKVFNTSINNLVIPKNHYVELVIEWCHNNLKNHNTKKPTVTVKYHQNKKVHGTYNPSTHEIIVYVNTHSTIKELTNTVIHEYIHARQKNRSFNKKYNEQNNTVGYLKNIYEVEARIITGKNEEKSIKDIISRYKVLK